MESSLNTLIFLLIFLWSNCQLGDAGLTESAVTTVINERTHLHCPYASKQEKLTEIAWYVGSTKTPAAIIYKASSVKTRLDDLLYDSATLTWDGLTIGKTTLKHEGSYKCLVSVDGIPTGNTFVINVTVTVPPTGLKIVGLRRPLFENDVLDATCIVPTVKPLVDLYWQHQDGSLISAQNQVRRNADGTFHVSAHMRGERVSYRNDGTYLQCIATERDEVEPVLRRVQQRVSVYHKPHGSATIEPMDLRVRLGSEGLELECIAPSAPGRPRASWTLWQKRWDDRWQVNTTRLLLFQPETLDAPNQFRCSVGNHFGTSDWSPWASVQILDPSEAETARGALANIPMLIGIVIGCVVLICVIIALLVMVRRRRDKALKEKVEDNSVDKHPNFAATEPDVVHEADEIIPLQSEPVPMMKQASRPGPYDEIPFADVPFMRPQQKHPDSDRNENLYANVPRKDVRDDSPPTPPEPLRPDDGITYAKLDFKPQQYKKPPENKRKTPTVYADVRFDNRRAHDV